GFAPDVSRHGLGVERPAGAGDTDVARDSLSGDLPADAFEPRVPADRLEDGIARDLATDLDVPRDGVDLESAEPAGDVGVGRNGLARAARGVRDRGPHAQVVSPEERAEREAEASLPAVGDNDAVAVLTDLDVCEEPLVAVNGDARLLALGRLDLDVAGRNFD